MIVYIMPRHFHNYSQKDPKGYQAFSDNLHNSFVAFTHIIGLSRFFSFTPPFLSGGLEDIPNNDGPKKDYEPHHKNLYK